MRLLPATAKGLAFLLNDAERHLFSEVLQQYPVVPAGHHTLSKSLHDEAAEENQRLLHTELAEQRTTLKPKIAVWLAATGRWRPTQRGSRLTVPREDTEWLLQVLNDIRIGSWLQLGAPETHLNPTKLKPAGQQAWANMELSGAFQMALLHALERDAGL